MPKKILYWGPYTGHVGTIKAQVNSAFAMHAFGGHDVSLIRVHSEFRGMDNELTNMGIRLVDLGLSRYFPGLEESSLFARRPYMLVAALIGFFPLVRSIRRERPEVLVLNLLVAPAILAAKLARVPVAVIVSVQGYPHFLGIEGARTPVWKRIENAVRKTLWNSIYPQADAVLTMTEQTREKLSEHTAIKKKQLRTLPNPVIDSRLMSNGSEPLDHAWYGKEIPVIVGMGRLTHQKGFDILIRAFSKVVKKGLEARLVILGEGEDRAKLESLTRSLDIEAFVEFIGHKDNPFPYIAQATLFVLSSRWEDPGHAIIEAAALGAPIVTTDCPSGPSDLVSHGAGGLICRTEDPDDMAEKILLALTEYNPEMKRVASRNAEKYTLRSHYEEMEKLIEGIV